MKDTDLQLVRELMRTQPVAALGTLHKGQPFVSMVPYAVSMTVQASAAGTQALPCFLIHVSRLAMHTQDMLRESAVSLMVMAPQRPDVMPQATPRFTVQGQALPLASESGDALHAWHETAKRAYLARFPDSEPMFGFGDFSLMAITPQWVRIVGGFAQATTVMAPDLAQAFARHGRPEGAA